MWADENNGFEDYNPQHRSFCGVTSILHTQTAGQGFECLSALEATVQAGLNTIKPSESWMRKTQRRTKEIYRMS